MLTKTMLTPGKSAKFLSLAGLAVVGLLATGCGDRRITFMQDDYINTGVHCDRQHEDRTGEPLDLAIVCVYPSDLKKEVDGVKVNHGLRPDGGITSEEWYEKCPISSVSDGSKGRFSLPPDQIYLLTNESNQAKLFGTKIGPALNGAKIDGQSKVIKADIEYKGWSSGDSDAVIYVFAKFKDRNGKPLRTPPAKFNPPGHYKRDLSLRIGVRQSEECSGPTLGQYIEVGADSRK